MLTEINMSLQSIKKVRCPTDDGRQARPASRPTSMSPGSAHRLPSARFAGRLRLSVYAGDADGSILGLAHRMMPSLPAKAIANFRPSIDRHPSVATRRKGHCACARPPSIRIRNRTNGVAPRGPNRVCIQGRRGLTRDLPRVRVRRWRVSMEPAPAGPGMTPIALGAYFSERSTSHVCDRHS